MFSWESPAEESAKELTVESLLLLLRPLLKLLFRQVDEADIDLTLTFVEGLQKILGLRRLAVDQGLVDLAAKLRLLFQEGENLLGGQGEETLYRRVVEEGRAQWRG